MFYASVAEVNFITRIIERTCSDLMYGLGELTLLQDANNRTRVCSNIVHRVDQKIRSEFMRALPEALVIRHPSEMIMTNDLSDVVEAGDVYPDYENYGEDIEEKNNWPFLEGGLVTDKPCFLAPYLEGAANLERGGYEFSVSLARITPLHIECVVVYLPALNEVFWASKDRHAFLQHRRIWPTKHNASNDKLVIHEFCAEEMTKSWATVIFKLRRHKNCVMHNPRHLSGSLMRLSMGCIDVLITDTLPTWLPAYFIAQKAGVVTSKIDDRYFLLASANNIKLVNQLLV